MGSFPKDFLFWFQFSIIYWKSCCFGVCKHKLGLRIIRFLLCRYFNPETSYIFCLKEAHYYIRFGFFIKSTILINIIRTYYILYFFVYIYIYLVSGHLSPGFHYTTRFLFKIYAFLFI